MAIAYKRGVLWAAILGALGIIHGAFGAHLLKNYLTESQLDSWATAVDYHLIHALFILVLALVSDHRIIRWSIGLACAGVLMFSGSIYLLCLQDVLGVSLRFLGPVTPIGGLLMIAAWLNLCRVAWMKQ